MLTQAELEEEMVIGGRERLLGMMKRNEDNAGAANNPYASAILRRFVQPMAELIEQDICSPRPGRNKAHVTLLKGGDPSAIAYLAVKSLLNSVCESDSAKAHTIMNRLGGAIFSEMYLTCFEQVSPALFHSVMKDIERRGSKDERYRDVTFKMQARRSGIDLPSWGIGSKMQVGAYLTGLAEQLGMVEIHRGKTFKNGKANATIEVTLAPDILELITSIKDSILDTCPVFYPCVEKPRDWVDLYSGGWHTEQMLRISPTCVQTSRKYRDLLRKGNWEVPFKALNTLQGVRWQINKQVLQAVKDVSAYYSTDEICSRKPVPKPERPYDIPEDLKKEDMTPDQQARFREWRKDTAQWFTESKVRATKMMRFAMALRVAEKFSEYPVLYFVYYADFRGRMYAQTTGVSPQGSDLQKALLRFEVGKPLSSPEAVAWFKINGANKYGYDKASLEDRARWVDERHAFIMAAAEDPVTNFEAWSGADCPLQYLAWCFEYRRWQLNPEGFKSHLPVGMDGSCNGLQNFSAMLRDEVGGKATNLIPGSLPNDIYADVARVTLALLLAWEPIPSDDEKKQARNERDVALRAKWLEHGINRSLVKRSVMTKPYGSTRFSCADFIVGDYLKAGLAPEFDKAEYSVAAQFLSRFVWEAIGQVVIKADEAMEWLQKASTKIMADGAELIAWKAPSGFPVVQHYERIDTVKIQTRLSGPVRLRVGIGSDEPDKARSRNGIAPNMVHCVDASHMALVACAGSDAGLSLAMIHDDFGCHAEDAPTLYRIIRETFIKMHEEHNPLKELAEAYDLPEPPSMGTLDIRQVMDSPYFFS